MARQIDFHITLTAKQIKAANEDVPICLDRLPAVVISFKALCKSSAISVVKDVLLPIIIIWITIQEIQTCIDLESQVMERLVIYEIVELQRNHYRAATITEILSTDTDNFIYGSGNFFSLVTKYLARVPEVKIEESSLQFGTSWPEKEGFSSLILCPSKPKTEFVDLNPSSNVKKEENEYRSMNYPY